VGFSPSIFLAMHKRKCRYESALRHLVAAGPTEQFEGALALARKQGLLRLLLQLYKGGHSGVQRGEGRGGEVPAHLLGSLLG
jgi:hypothetical protein